MNDKADRYTPEYRLKRKERNGEDQNEWIFTFGMGQPLAGYCIRIEGSYSEARAKMWEQFGDRWAFQYSAEEWDEMKKNPNRIYPMEKEIAL